MTDEDVADQRTPEYGPRGYLPPRAARRARKIVLREPMGLQWAVAALVAGVLVLVAGGLLLTSRLGPPDAPFAAAGPLADIDPGGAGVLTDGTGTPVLIVRAAGRMSVFAAPDTGGAPSWCAATSRLVVEDEAVWQADGRLVGGRGQSLALMPAQVHDGVVYVDTSGPGTRLPPLDRGEPAECEATGP